MPDRVTTGTGKSQPVADFNIDDLTYKLRVGAITEEEFERLRNERKETD